MSREASGWAYLTRRLLMLPPILLVVSLLTFMIAAQVPADERARATIDKYPTPELIAEIVEREVGVAAIEVVG